MNANRDRDAASHDRIGTLTPSERTAHELQQDGSLVRELLGQMGPRTKTVVSNLIDRLTRDTRYEITVRYNTESSDSEPVLVTEGISELEILRQLADDPRCSLERIARYGVSTGPTSCWYVVSSTQQHQQDPSMGDGGSDR